MGELSVGPMCNIIIDDPNEQDDHVVQSRLSRLVAAQRRRNRHVTVTAYLATSAATLRVSGADVQASIEIPYFSELEWPTWCGVAGGDHNHIEHVFREATQGHLQLTMATLLRLSREGWPMLDTDRLSERGRLADLDVERLVARRLLLRNADEAKDPVAPYQPGARFIRPRVGDRSCARTSRPAAPSSALSCLKPSNPAADRRTGAPGLARRQGRGLHPSLRPQCGIGRSRVQAARGRAQLICPSAWAAMSRPTRSLQAASRRWVTGPTLPSPTGRLLNRVAGMMQ